MELTFNKKDMSRLLRLHRPFVSSFQKPRGDVIRLKCEGGVLSATTGLSDQAKIVSEDPEGLHHRGRFCWDLRLSELSKLVNAAKTGESLALVEGKDGVSFQVSGAEFKMEKAILEIYFDHRSPDLMAKLPARVFRDALFRVAHCAGKKESSRLWTKGVWLQFRDDELSVVYALDGFRMGVVTFGNHQLAHDSAAALLPQELISGLIAVLDNAGDKEAIISAYWDGEEQEGSRIVKLGLLTQGQCVTLPVPDIKEEGVGHIIPANVADWSGMDVDSRALDDSLQLHQNMVGKGVDKCVRIGNTGEGLALQGKIVKGGYGAEADRVEDHGALSHIKADILGEFKSVWFCLAYLKDATKSAVKAGGGRLRIRVNGDDPIAQFTREDEGGEFKSIELIAPSKNFDP